MRSGLGLLRWHLHGPDSRQHQGDHHPGRSARAAHHAGVSRVCAGAPLSHRCGPGAACRATKGGSNGPSPRPRRLLCRRSPHDAGGRAHARPPLVSRRLWPAPAQSHAAAPARALSRRGAARPAAGADHAVRHPALERAQSRARSARLGRQGDLFDSASVRRPGRHRPRRCTARPLLCPRAADQNASPQTAGRPIDRCERLSRRTECLRLAQRRRVAAPGRAGRRDHWALRRRAARQPVAVDADAARVCAARPGPPLWRRARDRGLHRRPRRRPARCAAPATHARTTAPSRHPRRLGASCRAPAISAPPPSMRCRFARPRRHQKERSPQ